MEWLEPSAETEEAAEADPTPAVVEAIVPKKKGFDEEEFDSLFND